MVERTKLVTIRDVARAAGVSVATASRALGGHRRVGPEATEKVIKAAAQLGYQPNVAARGLRQARTRSLGIVYRDLDSPVALSILKGINGACQQAGFSLMVTNGQGDASLSRSLIQHLFERRVDGLFLSVPMQLGSALAPYSASGIPVLALFAKDESAREVPLVAVRENEALAMAARRLVDLGHRSIAQFMLPVEALMAHRLTAVEQALEQGGRGEGCRVRRVIGGDRIEEVRRATFQALTQEELPTAIIAPHQWLPGIYLALAQMGLRVPDDISVVSLLDSPWSQIMTPPIAAVSVDNEELGRSAARVMLGWLEGQEPPRVTYAAVAQWVERGSIAQSRGPERSGLERPRAPGRA